MPRAPGTPGTPTIHVVDQILMAIDEFEGPELALGVDDRRYSMFGGARVILSCQPVLISRDSLEYCCLAEDSRSVIVANKPGELAPDQATLEHIRALSRHCKQESGAYREALSTDAASFFLERFLRWTTRIKVTDKRSASVPKQA